MRALTANRMEIWEDIEGYDGRYKISNLGNIYSEKLQGLLSVWDKHGYLRANLSKGRGKWVSVHRLVALAFIPNPDNKGDVNHKDGNKKNNRVDNLEWVTRRENIIHALKNGLVKHKNKSSKYNGVCKTRSNTWIAYSPRENVKRLYLGSYKTEEEANQAVLNYKNSNPK